MITSVPLDGKERSETYLGKSLDEVIQRFLYAAFKELHQKVVFDPTKGKQSPGIVFKSQRFSTVT